jgi:hypothetical protein
MSQYSSESREPEVSGWAVGGIAFAATIMVMIGVFQAIVGIVAIVDDSFFLVTKNYTFEMDTTAWGWIHLILGVLLTVSGFYLFARRPWAGIVALTLALLSAIANFFFIPQTDTIWPVIIIALDVWVIWALTRPGAITA